VSAPDIAATFAHARLAERFGRTYGAVDLTAAQTTKLLERALSAA
jgi:hypothetical protein